MSYAFENGRIVVRQGGGCVAWVFLPTVLLGIGLTGASVVRLLARRRNMEPEILALLLLAGLIMLVGGLAGLTGRSMVVVDPVGRVVEVTLRLLGFSFTKRHPFEVFDRVEVLSGRTRHSRFWFPALRGRNHVSFARTSYEDACELAGRLSYLLGIPVVR